MNRRHHLAALGAMAAALLPVASLRAVEDVMGKADPQYGLIGEDSANADALWIVELWDSKASHQPAAKAGT